MWSLHKLGEGSRKRSLPASASADSGSGSGPEPDAAKRPVVDATNPGQAARPISPPPDGASSKSIAVKSDTYDWGFRKAELDRFPALRKRNFWCVQRHQATALHYDLRMQLDGVTVSWAIPKGLLGISKSGEASRLAVETTLHPISYTTHEGSDGRSIRCGTRTYRIDPLKLDEEDSGSESERRRKRRRYRGGGGGPESDDPLGRHQEDQFRALLHRPLGYNKARSIHFTLMGGRKLKEHSYILILPSGNSRSRSYLPDGREKKQWFIRLPRGVEEYPWGSGGEDGEEYGRSVKTGRTFREVCHSKPARAIMWQTELGMFAGWGENVKEFKEQDKANAAALEKPEEIDQDGTGKGIKGGMQDGLNGKLYSGGEVDRKVTTPKAYRL